MAPALYRQTPLKSAACALLFGAGVLVAVFGGFAGHDLLTRIAILAMLALALDLVAGFGGLISLCHGALFGVGAYAFATTAENAGAVGATGLAVLFAATVAGAIGAATARAGGIFLIMATLAFGQMLYAIAAESPYFGGSDGLFGAPRVDLSAVGLDSGDYQTFAVLCLAAATAVFALLVVYLRSGSGRALVGLHANEARMRALGLSTWRLRASAFAVSGAAAGLAGALHAQYNGFVSPELLDWRESGQLLVVVILGGLGTLVGAVLGAAILILLKDLALPWLQGVFRQARREATPLADGETGFSWWATYDALYRAMDYWHFFLGALLIAAVVLGGRGLYGALEHRLEGRAARRPRSEDAP